MASVLLFALRVGVFGHKTVVFFCWGDERSSACIDVSWGKRDRALMKMYMIFFCGSLSDCAAV